MSALAVSLRSPPERGLFRRRYGVRSDIETTAVDSRAAKCASARGIIFGIGHREGRRRSPISLCYAAGITMQCTRRGIRSSGNRMESCNSGVLTGGFCRKPHVAEGGRECRESAPSAPRGARPSSGRADRHAGLVGRASQRRLCDRRLAPACNRMNQRETLRRRQPLRAIVIVCPSRLESASSHARQARLR